MKTRYLSMAEAAKICPYEQGYLSLLARRGELKAEKNGRNWYTTVEWLNEYIRKKKPNAEIIREHHHRDKDKITKKEKNLFKVVWIWLTITTAIIIVGVFVFGEFYDRVNEIEDQSNQFIPEEIVKIPDEQGNFDVYSKGTIKIGKESVK